MIREIFHNFVCIKPFYRRSAIFVSATSHDLVFITTLTNIANKFLVLSLVFDRNALVLETIFTSTRRFSSITIPAKILLQAFVRPFLPFIVIDIFRAFTVPAGGLDLLTTIFALLRHVEAHHFIEEWLVLVSTFAAWVVAFNNLIDL